MEITKIPDKILAKKLEIVNPSKVKNGEFNSLFLDMKKAMKENQGVGLAANQIGKDLAVFVIDERVAKESEISEVYINPEITEYSKDDDEMEEGCLSIPEFYIPIKRSKKIKIKFINESGEKIKLKVRGFAARVLQHETDHLNGLTIKNRSDEK
ncbi:MAG: peptide deformylase [Candidatus Yanofskybacteria bacterium RIFCSPHIGHO2_02_FULL_38_22b]|uniref:Peptide deformylase n=1 Tax=Candidatus Yanofskybacteria bacterium RIFCSPHIGHO2_02_FULL_38_22b TaxID=1802673 RepID=A0A1F8F2E3_9BACT|nr:MAG: peptide deformylase [Candidatus Yanofskybacteria bacterium RIFCSPHIGHO2_02_FULL_38_22b]OGN20366.1 MAG: peptide deformylase [Candidatus Yanofskybacteria bacterium RIFCSPLOWO2_01_FULL_39_28]